MKYHCYFGTEHKCPSTAHDWDLSDFIVLHYSILTPWSRVLLEKRTGFQLGQKFSAFYGTRKFGTAFRSARHLSLSWAGSIQSTPLHSTSWRSILILSSHLRLCLPSCLFPSGFPTRILYTPLFSPKRATCPAHLILLDFITRRVWNEETIKLFITLYYITDAITVIVKKSSSLKFISSPWLTNAIKYSWNIDKPAQHVHSYTKNRSRIYFEI